MAIHTIKTKDRDYVLNFNSYAVMQAFRKYGAEGLATVTKNELNFDMIKWGGSKNGSLEVSDQDVYDMIDAIGGVFGDTFGVEIYGYVLEAFNIPTEASKKKEEEA
jgi:hypothetical protein